MNTKYIITLLPGDGIGPELTQATKLVLEATGVQIEWEELIAGEGAIEKYGTPLPEHVLESIRKNKIALKGPITTPIGSGFRSVNVALRKSLELYACVRPCKTLIGVKSRYTDVDLVIVRENTEDLYAGVEFEPNSKESKEIIKLSDNKIREGSAISIKPISEFGTERIVRYAFEYAKKNGRKKVTAVTKANIMKHTDGLFLEVAKKVSEKYPGIEYDEKLIDNMCMQLVQKPENMDVIVLPNLYGDIVSDLCAGLIGGLGVAPGANIGENGAVFEPVHGSAPKYKGLNKANPMALILSSAMMLDYMGEKKAGDKVRTAVEYIVKENKKVTYDLGGSYGTLEMGEAIAEVVASL